MRDMLVVELVERVLVDVLDVHPETVLPHALLAGDLGATRADVLAVLQRLQPVLQPDAVDRLVPAGSVQPAEPAGSFSVAELVDLVVPAAVHATTEGAGQRSLPALPRPRRTVSNTMSSPR